MTDEEGTGQPTSIRFEHCKRLYEEMERQAIREDDGFLYYEGHLTKLFAQQELSTPYYGLFKQYLVPMGCLVQLRRGGSSTPSRWLLCKPPTEESFASFDNMKRRASGKYAQLEQENRLLRERMARAEAWIERAEIMINGFVQRFERIENGEEPVEYNRVMEAARG